MEASRFAHDKMKMEFGSSHRGSFDLSFSLLTERVVNKRHDGE